MKQDKVILGFDPGTTIMGYGLIHVFDKQIHLITMDVMFLKKYKSHQDKLKRIFEKTLSIIDQYHPDELSLEAPFYGKNIQSMLKLGRAQGVAMAAGLYKGLPIFEYAPKKIKQSITGNGNASKIQVAAMLQRILSIPKLPKELDATDGLATAVCHYFQADKTTSQKTYKDWKTYAEMNKDKIIR